MHLIYIDLFPSAFDLFLSTQHDTINIHIFLRAFFMIVEYIDLFKIFINHLTWF